jgi:hypothetical protein
MTTPALTARPLSQITSAPVRWLWERYLPRGKLAILDGDPGVGKSLLALDLAARLSRGGYLPDGTAAADRPHVTLILSGEDGAEDTLRPRAEATGGDLDRVLVVASTDGPLPRFPADVPALEESIRAHRADLVVIDPVMAFLPPEVAANSDQCVRGALNVLAELAERTDCTILLVRHLRKKEGGKAIHRGLASVGIIGSVRAGLMAAPHPADPELRVLAVTKTNLARKPPALGFRLVGDDAGRAAVAWEGPLDVPADALGLPVPVPLFPRDRAADWLHRELARGPRKVTELLAAAAEAGIPDRTLERAKAELRVKAQFVHSRGGERAWYWYDPCAPWPADAPFQKPFELPPLDPL